MDTLERSSGAIEYLDTGAGPVIVFLHGLLMDASLWDAPIADLQSDCRCIAPTLPVGLTAAGSEPGGTDRIGRAVVVLYDAYDNFPPGLTGNVLSWSAYLAATVRHLHAATAVSAGLAAAAGFRLADRGWRRLRKAAPSA